MNLIDGKAIAAKVHAESRMGVEALKKRGVTPGLAVVLVGEDPASRTYVRSKARMCLELGLYSAKHELPAETSQEDLVALVRQLNADPAIHGILVQSPPPPHIDEAAVVATSAADQFTHKVVAVSYSIAAPQVIVSGAHLDGVSDAFGTRVRAVLNEAVKNPFSTMDSVSNIERAVEQFYSDQGYAAAKVQVTRSGDPATTPEAIVVPFAIRVEEGRVYTVTSIQLPPGTPLTQAEIEKALAPMPGGPPLGVRVRAIWLSIASKYHSKGYLDCKVTPHASINDADATVSYTVDVDPGPVYHLAFVKFDNVSDELRTHLIHYWEMMPGDPFDESYVANFIVKVQQQDPALRQSLSGVKTKFDATANPNTHEVNLVIRLER